MKPPSAWITKNPVIEHYARKKQGFFRKRLVIALIGFQLLMSGLFIVLMRVETDQILLDQAEAIIKNSITRAAITLENSFDSHESDVNYFASLISRYQFDLDSEVLRNSFFSALEAKPYLDAVYFSNQRHEFFLVSRSTAGLENEHLLTHRMSFDSEGILQSVKTRYDRSGRVLQTEYTPTGYKASERPWHKAALAAEGKVTWVGPYIFADNESSIGFATSRAVNPGSPNTEVIAIDLTVSDLSSTLSQSALDRRVNEVIFDRQGRIIAAGHGLTLSSAHLVAKDQKIPSISELNHPVLSAIFTCFEQQSEQFSQPQAQRVHCDGLENRILAATSVQIIHDTPWYLVSLGSKQDFLDALRHKEAHNLLLLTLITLVAAVMTIVLSRHLARPLLHLHLKTVTDRLTGLLNRRGLEVQVNSLLVEGNARHACQVVAIIDIDHFKQVNDTYGHDAGDVVIAKVASVLQETVGSHGATARLGGEEFALLLDMPYFQAAVDLIEAARAKIEQCPIQTASGLIHCTISAGLCQIHRHDLDDWEKALKLADLALYQAKNGGRNRYEIAFTHHA